MNTSRVLGANGAVSYSNVVQQAAKDSASRAKYGTWEGQISASDASEQQTLDDKANALLRPNPIKTIDFTPDPKLGPMPFDDYYVGDTVYFYANRNALVEGPTPVRVNAFTVVIDPDTGLEAAEIPNPETPDEESTIRASLLTEVVA
jgi:hypothetical protein